jgi:hypothetical protein
VNANERSKGIKYSVEAAQEVVRAKNAPGLELRMYEVRTGFCVMP